MPIPDRSRPVPAFDILSPVVPTTPLVFNSPHSGSVYPEDFLAVSRLDESAIRRSEDSHVDDLFVSAVEKGAPLLRANFPRAWLDVNREPYELDPKMFASALPNYANVRSVRVAGGLGTIARIVSESEEIYDGPLDVDEALGRINRVYKPYHEALASLLEATRRAFGYAVLIDCHSMPSIVRGGAGQLRPDVVIGDRYGASCAGELADIAGRILARLGYSVSRNKPYAGGHITEYYGRPDQGIHALQIEVKRSLYMNEDTLEKTAGFRALTADLSRFIDELAGSLEAGLLDQRPAAE